MYTSFKSLVFVATLFSLHLSTQALPRPANGVTPAAAVELRQIVAETAADHIGRDKITVEELLERVVIEERDGSDDVDSFNEDEEERAIAQRKAKFAVSMDVAASPPGSQNNPITAYVDCTGIEQLCDSNCYAILCLDRPQLLQKVSQTVAKQNRQDCGAKGQPFKGTTQQLANRGLSRPDSTHVSAEEFPYASTAQGGNGADLFPVRVADQTTQRDAIRNMYNTYNVGIGDYFNLNFNNANTPYCNALRDGDYSVCDDDINEPWGFDFGVYAFVRNSLKGQRLMFDMVGKT